MLETDRYIINNGTGMKIMYEIFLSFIDLLMKLINITKAITISICFMFKS